ncbi:MAG: hypothetical protein K0R18_479 [Bacillales bacterium]|jgi:N-acetylmuramoyl-L-alanine amidase CwlA|nr:hypothetical protein [Bacillales bacterium]
MGYQVKDTLLPAGVNRPGTRLNPVGVIIHETATPNATDEAEYRYFCGGNRNASAHYFVDYDSISKFIPENEQAWHAGPTANKRYVGIELCHFDEEAKFQEIWKRGVWLVADMCKRYGWNPSEAIHSHHWCSQQWRETNHSDPDDYFADHGQSMASFIADVKKVLNQSATPKYNVYQNDNLLSKFADYDDAVQEAKKWSNSSVREIATGNWVWSNIPAKKVFKINVNGVEEHYDTVEEAYKRGWDLLKAGYKDVFAIEPDGVYTFAKHPEDNPYAYRLNVNGVIEVYFNKKEGYDRGWQLYNNGYPGVVMTDPDGIYTFDKHQDENPAKKTIPTPQPTPVKGTLIKGLSEVTDGDAIDAYIKQRNPKAPSVGKAYIKIGAQLGIRGDIAICQAIKETGWFKFGGDVTADQNNFCGLGTTGGGVKGASFATVEEGVMAHMQHLWAYITNQPLPNGIQVIDPRFKLVQSLNKNANSFEDLGGRWAVPGFDKNKYTSFDEAFKNNATYGQDIVKMFEAMKTAVGTTPPATKPVPQEKPTSDNEEFVKRTEKKDVFYTFTNIDSYKILSVVVDGKGYVRASDIADRFNQKALFDNQTSEIVISSLPPARKPYDAPGDKQIVNIDVYYTVAHLGNSDMEALIIDGKGFVRATGIAKAFGYAAKYDTKAQEIFFVR